jgi:hypothetical protein
MSLDQFSTVSGGCTDFHRIIASLVAGFEFVRDIDTEHFGLSRRHCTRLKRSRGGQEANGQCEHELCVDQELLALAASA